MARTSLAQWHTVFFAALGLTAPGACGGSSADGNPIPANVRSCINPSPFIDEGTGFVNCDGGWVHRRSRGVCPSSIPRAASFCPDGGSLAPDGGGSSSGGAQMCCGDLECSSIPNGFCLASSGCGLVLGQPPICLAGCVSDADCQAGSICLCGEPIGQCVLATCSVDADCGPGSLCAGESEFRCQTGADECLANSQCPGDICDWREDHRVCSGGICGRPFLVGDVMRMADLAEGGSWLDQREVAIGDPSEKERLLLARHYADMGRMEHASVAAFARFALELLALGAPADLLEATQSAIADEIRHARSCFSLASRYARRELGPAPLPVHDALGTVTLLGVVRTAIREACIGETLAAIEAAEAAEQASIADVRGTLRQIRDDETRHASFGWRFLRWAIDRSSTAERETILAELRAAVDERACVGSFGDWRGVPAHGMLSAAARGLARRDALDQVIGPMVAALMKDEVSRGKGSRAPGTIPPST